MEEGEEVGLCGNRWLFLGEEYFSREFLYEREWEGWVKDERLGKLGVGF
ncbi:hypothetical protein [Staphylococcus saprophyticus]|nr:hypothetical protein [Staphylococcus saprophyticus]